MSKKVKSRECRFAVHIKAKHGLHPDLHLIKEQVTYEDGTMEPNVRLVQDFQRPFWVTTPSRRNHKQKKEWEDIENVLEYQCTDSELRDKVAMALDKQYSNKQLRELAVSPYLYGIEIPATSLIKQKYLDKYPVKTPYSVAVFDIETRKEGNNTIIVMATLAFRNKVYTAVLEDVVRGISNVPMMLQLKMDHYLPAYVGKLDTAIEVCANEVDMISGIFKRAHKWNPDILTAWNINYDFPKVFEMLERHRVDPRDILCHPDIPKSARICKYIEGKKKKITASGKVHPISPASQWHTLVLTAGFYVLDAMCVYKQLRMANGEQPSYSLNAILGLELGSRKLTFTEADEYDGMRWHDFMRENYPIEYIVYNRYDCLSILELDEKTKDLSFTAGEYAGITDFSRFNSQPKRIADALHFYCLEKGKVLGCVGFEKEVFVDYEEEIGEGEADELDADTLGLEGWIVTLASSLQALGLNVIEEDNKIRTNLRAYVFDVDETAAYPTATEVCNVSRETTFSEIIDIDGDGEFRLQNINLLAGPTNAIEYCVNMFGFPSPDELLKFFQDGN